MLIERGVLGRMCALICKAIPVNFCFYRIMLFLPQHYTGRYMNKFGFQLYMAFFALTVSAYGRGMQQGPIRFELSFTEPQAHYIDVLMEIPEVTKDYLEVSMPVWAPGSYLIREFSKNVEGFEAVGASGKPLDCEKVTKNTWRIRSAGEGAVRINYRVYAFEVSVRTSFVDASHAFIAPTGVFMFADGEINRASEVTVRPHAAWTKISTGLESVAGKPNTYSAKDFDVLFDSPIEIGNQDIFTFNAAGVLHEVAMVGGGSYDKERLKTDMAKIVEQASLVFGENPNKRYVFIVHHYSSGGGGLEHLNSSVLGASRTAYDTERGYLRFLGLVAHEYFHLWNIKRLRPEALGPFDYHAENYTTNLWIGEGFTTYYASVLVHRAGFNKEEAFLDGLLGNIHSVENQGGNLVQSLSEASFDAWIKYYRPNENSINTDVSYYTKGGLIALLLDLKLLHVSKGKIGLDDLMRKAYDTFYKKQGRGYTDAEFKALAEELAGVSLDDIYQYVYKAGSVDYNPFMAYAGMQLVQQNALFTAPDFGARTRLVGGKFIVASVVRASSAWDGGINVNDELLAINGQSLDIEGKAYSSLLEQTKVGDEWQVTVSRDGISKTLPVRIKASQTKRFKFDQVPNPSAAQLAVRQKWLWQK